jgi:hypothetical protein
MSYTDPRIDLQLPDYLSTRCHTKTHLQALIRMPQATGIPQWPQSLHRNTLLPWRLTTDIVITRPHKVEGSSLRRKEVQYLNKLNGQSLVSAWCKERVNLTHSEYKLIKPKEEQKFFVPGRVSLTFPKYDTNNPGVQEHV